MSDTTVSDVGGSRGADPLVGTTLADKYDILSFVGKGGMSQVYRAKHNLIDKIVAVKVMLPQLSTNEKAVKRFRQEAKAASQLDHPNMVSVSDFGETPDKRPFLVMDFLQGDSVSDLIKEQGKLSVELTLDIMVQTCSALKTAHEKGVIHRDLKPSNLMLLHDDRGNYVVKIVDFGIAKLLPAEGGDAQGLTQTGEMFGSPPYMSPEQCQGRKVDERTDIYSMGCVMYEMLTGHVPLRGENMFETMYMHIHNTPEGLGDAVKDGALREQLERVIYRTLAKDPAERYPSMEWLLTDLRELQKGESKRFGARIKAFWQLLWLKHLPKKQRPIWRTVMVLAVVLIGVAWGTQSALLSPPDVKLPEVTWRIDEKSASPTMKKEDANEQIEKLINEMKSTTEGGPPAAIKGGERLATLYFDSGQYANAAQFFTSSVKLREETAPDDKVGIARDYIRIGDCYYLLRDYARAIEDYMYGISLLKRNSLTVTGLARACFRLATIYEDKFEYERAENYYRHAIEYYNEGTDGSVIEKRPERALAMSRLADVKHFQYTRAKNDELQNQDMRRAQTHISELKERLKNLEKQGLSSDSAVMQEAQKELNTTEVASREAKAKVLEHYQAAVEAYKAVMKEWFRLADYRNYAVASYHLAWLHEEQSMYDEAAKCYRYCLDTFPRVLSSEDDPYIAATADSYSRVLWKQHRWHDWFRTKMRANKIKRAYKIRSESAAKSG